MSYSDVFNRQVAASTPPFGKDSIFDRLTTRNRKMRPLTYGEAALAYEVERVGSAPHGSRNDTLNRAAFAIGQLVAGGEIPEHIARERLTDAARLAGLDDREIDATLDSGLTAGMTQPRTAPVTGATPGPTVLDDEQPETAYQRRLDELRGRLLNVDGLRAIPAPEPLVDGWLFRDSLAWLGGKPGHGKSFVAVDLACSIGTGTDWHGHKVTPGKVLYLIAEGASGISLRVDAWALAHGRQVENVLFLPVAVQLLHAIDTAAFRGLLAELTPDLVILDTQARVTVGGDENSSKDMGRFVDTLEQLRLASGACILSVHHEARNGDNLRGSTALEGAATSILRATKDGDVIQITNTKQKDTPEQPPLTLALTPLSRSAVLSHEDVGLGGTTESERHVLTVLAGFGTKGATKTELREAAGLPKTTWYRSINALLAAGLVREVREGRSTYYVPTVDHHQDTIDG